MLDKDAPTALSDDEIMPLSRGDLAPKTVYVDKAISLTEGEVITVYGRWSPSNASVSVGIWDTPLCGLCNLFYLFKLYKLYCSNNVLSISYI